MADNILIRLLFFIVIISTAPRTLVWAQDSSENQDPMIAELSLSLYEWSPGQGGDLKINLQLPKGFHAYEDMFRLTLLEPDGFRMTPFKLTPIVEFYDKFSKKKRRGVTEKSSLTTHLEAPLVFRMASSKLKFELTYQACSETFCLFPTTKKLDVSIVLIGAPEIPLLKVTTQATPPSISHSFFSQEFFANALGTGGAIVFLLAFVAGVLTSFTPCIFPMIPITLAVLGNDSQKRSRTQNFIVSCVYVTGIATTYSILGVVAATSGTLFGASLGNPYILSVICFVFLAMALSMYGLYDLQVPAFIRQRFGRKVAIGNLHLKTYLTGLFAGIAASPCVGPVLVTILAYVATRQNMLLGFFLLFTYALGLGLIFLLLGLSSQVTRLLPRSGAWMNGVKFVLGSLMLAAFYYYLELLIPERAFDVALGIGLISVSSFFGAFAHPKNALQGLRKGLMLATLIVGFGYLSIGTFELRTLLKQRHISEELVPKAQQLDWQPYSDAALQKAIQEKKPVIIDFWAEWCASCHELEQFTFTNPLVKEITKSFALLKFDATKDSKNLRDLKLKYNIQGLPTVLFYNADGLWLPGLTLTNFESAPNFLKRIEKVKN